MEVHNSRAPALARPLLHRKIGRGDVEMWRRVEEGERDWRGKSGRRIQLGKILKKKREEGEQQPGLGAYWVKENKTCHLAKERR